MIVIFSFGLLLPLTLLIMASSIICFIVDRPRIAFFFVFLAVNFLRQFTFFSYWAYNQPISDSWTYAFLSSEFSYIVIWGGLLISMIFAYWDFWHNLGGVRGAKAATERARATYQVAKNQKLHSGQNQNQKESKQGE